MFDVVLAALRSQRMAAVTLATAHTAHHMRCGRSISRSLLLACMANRCPSSHTLTFKQSARAQAVRVAGNARQEELRTRTALRRDSRPAPVLLPGHLLMSRLVSLAPPPAFAFRSAFFLMRSSGPTPAVFAAFAAAVSRNSCCETFLGSWFWRWLGGFFQ
jgi:hypothetical protein